MLGAAREQGVKVVLISGARTSTVWERLPCLPQADAVVTENGGRIWFTDGHWKSCLPLREDLEWRKSLAPQTGTPHTSPTVVQAQLYRLFCEQRLSFGLSRVVM
jgi:hypothetical protein